MSNQTQVVGVVGAARHPRSAASPLTYWRWRGFNSDRYCRGGVVRRTPPDGTAVGHHRCTPFHTAAVGAAIATDVAGAAGGILR